MSQSQAQAGQWYGTIVKTIANATASTIGAIEGRVVTSIRTRAQWRTTTWRTVVLTIVGTRSIAIAITFLIVIIVIRRWTI